MRRWRTVGLVGIETSDQRLIEGSVAIRAQSEARGWPTIPLLWGEIGDRGHVGAEYREQIAVRVRGNKIQARLPRRYRTATPAFQADVDYRMPFDSEDRCPDSLDEMIEQCKVLVMVQKDPVLIGLGPGPSAWEELR